MAVLVLVIPVIVGIFSLGNSKDKGVMAVNETEQIEEIKLNQLITMIHEHKRGLEQEVFIKIE